MWTITIMLAAIARIPCILRCRHLQIRTHIHVTLVRAPSITHVSHRLSLTSITLDRSSMKHFANHGIHGTQRRSSTL